MTRSLRPLSVAAALALLALAGAAPALAQSIDISAESDTYAGLPFTLNVSARGFDDAPEPQVAPFDVPECKITAAGMTPNMSRSITIIGGQRTETRAVDFVFRYRVLCERAGTYRLPAITVTQGGKKAASMVTGFRIQPVAATRDMRLEVEVPDRPVIVGETFALAINWYLRAEVRDHHFAVPLFDETTWVDVHQPQLNGLQRRNALAFPAGDRQLELPYTRDEVTLDGTQYVRFRVIAHVTPIKAGTLTVRPSRVIAGLVVGGGRDPFGLTSRTRLFKAEDVARTIEIKPLPVAGRPPSFANAVGTAFSIQVRASRTVVKLGEPVELDVLIRGDGRLEGLSLPRLDNTDGLPAELFSVPDTPPTGEIVDVAGDGAAAGKGKGKRFRVVVQIKSPNVREIPPLAFSYYDPKTGRYDTVRSEPIALSVEGGAVVGAGDVVSAIKSAPEAAAPVQPAGGIGSFVGAELSLSSGAATLARPRTVADLRVLLAALYAVPLLFLAVRLWRVRTRARRDQRSGARKALRAALREIEAARSVPAREAGPRLLAALRAVAAATGADGLRGHELIARIETEAYSPRAASAPLADDLLAEARNLARILAERERAPGAARAVAWLLPWLALLGAGEAHARDLGAELDAARAAYQAALAETDRDARTSGFVRAEQLFRALAAAHPDRPELLTDWGNAALGAQDLGRATLAYRRALALDADQARAERNLAWVRARMPAGIPRPRAQEGSLFFWHDALSLPARHLLGAAAFCAAVLLVVPWSRRRRLLRRLAVLPALMWLAMLSSALLDDAPVDAAVVMTDGVPLLSADSAGAPPAMGQPLPAGAEVTVVEARGPWVRVRLADGALGWIAATSVERVLPR